MSMAQRQPVWSFIYLYHGPVIAGVSDTVLQLKEGLDFRASKLFIVI